MIIADITKKTEGEKAVPKPVAKKWPAFKFSAGFAVWLVFCLVVLVEIWAMYQYLYKNLIFEGDSPDNITAAAVRINYTNYDKVVSRLDRVKDFHATSTVDFIDKNLGMGRENPFTDPGK